MADPMVIGKVDVLFRIMVYFLVHEKTDLILVQLLYKN